jgi:hypothetical protein
MLSFFFSVFFLPKRVRDQLFLPGDDAELCLQDRVGFPCLVPADKVNRIFPCNCAALLHPVFKNIKLLHDFPSFWIMYIASPCLWPLAA